MGTGAGMGDLESIPGFRERLEDEDLLCLFVRSFLSGYTKIFLYYEIKKKEVREIEN